MTKLSTEIISFDDAGADDDHPVKGVTMGHIRRWFDLVEQYETGSLPGIGECTDEMAHAISGLDGYDHDRDMPTLQRWKDYWDAAIMAAPHLPDLPQEASVRALDWQETFTDRGDGSKDHTGWEADSGFGMWYSVEQYFASDSYGWEVKFDYEVISDHDDPDQAKQAAQADFAKRVASTLSRPQR